MTNPIELLIALGINDDISKTNIKNYIKNLKTENLEVTLSVKSDSSTSKTLNQTKKQLDSISNSASKTINDLKEAQDDIKNFLKGQGYKNFDFKLNVDSKSGQDVLKGFTATIRDVNNEIKKLEFDANKNLLSTKFEDKTLKTFDSSLNNVNKTLNEALVNSKVTTEQFKDFNNQINVINNNQFEPDKSGALDKLNQEIKEFISSSTQYNKFLKDVDNSMSSIAKSGMLSAETISNINMEIARIKSNENLTLDKKIHLINRQLIEMNNQVNKLKLDEEMEKSANKLQNLQSTFIRVVNTYKRETKNMDLSKYESEFKRLSNIQNITDPHLLREYNKEIDNLTGKVRRFQANVTEAMRGSLTIVDQLKVAWNASAFIQ